MAIVKISDLPLVDSPVEGTDLFVVVQDNVTKKAYASDIQTYVGFEEVQTATAGQTVFNLTTMTYAAGANNLMVFVDGVNQYEGLAYQETDNNTVTFTQGLHEGAVVKFSTVQTLSTVDTSSANILYNEGGVGAVTRSVQSKLREWVSVTDFGADPTGTLDSTQAFQEAINAAFDIFIPRGNYLITSSLRIPVQNSQRKKPVYIYGESGTPATETNNASTLIYYGTGACIDGVNGDPASRSILHLKDFVIRSATAKQAGTVGIDLQQPTGAFLENIGIAFFDIGIRAVGGHWYQTWNRLKITTCNTGIKVENDTNGMSVFESFIGDCSNYAVDLTNVFAQMSFSNCSFESNGIHAVRANYFWQLNFTNCYFEEANITNNIIRGLRKVGEDSQINLNGCYFTGGMSSGTACIYVDNPSNESINVYANNIFMWIPSTSTMTTFVGSNSASTKLYLNTPIQQTDTALSSKTLTSLVSGATFGGINLGDDDLSVYKKGTWTPSITFSGSTNNHTYAVRDGYYTRIGNQVTVNFRIQLSAKDASTNDVFITGLPYASVTNSSGASFSIVNDITLTSPYTQVTGQASSSSIRLLKLKNGSYDIILNSECGNAMQLFGSMTYLTA